LVPAHDLLERGLGAPERLRDQPRFLNAIDVDSDERSLAKPSYSPLRQDGMSRCKMKIGHMRSR